MSRLTRFVVLATTLVLALSMSGACAVKKKAPSKKPVAKVPHNVLGTSQLKGEYGAFNETYTLGKNDPMNIRLSSAEYSVGPVKVGDRLYMPKPDEKLLVLRMTYHNPRSRERFIRWDSFGFTVVDPQDKNHDGLKDLGMMKDNSSCSMSFKPAQKVDVYGVMAVPAKGEMPKLIIKSSDGLVIRYDIKGKVKGLSAPYADPADSTGATALDKIPAQIGTAYPVGFLTIKVNSAEYNTASEMGTTKLSKGQKFLVVSMDVKNEDAGRRFMRWDSFGAKLTDTDGVDVARCADMFQKSKDKSFSSNMEPGQELTVRCIFKVPDDTSLQTLSMNYDGSRPFLFDLTSVK